VGPRAVGPSREVLEESLTNADRREAL
jgi:hypothetical protein